MVTEEPDTIGQAFALQRDVVDGGRELVWDGLMLQRQVDELLMSSLEEAADGITRDVDMALVGARGTLGVANLLLPGDTSGVHAALNSRLDTISRTSDRVADEALDVAEAGFEKFEQSLLSALMRVNSRINELMARHEALEQRFRDLLERSQEEGSNQAEKLADLGERIAEHRRHLTELRVQLDRLRRRVQRPSLPGTA